MRGPKNDTWRWRDRKWWRELIEHLRDELPASQPIRVTRVSAQGYPGIVERRDGHYSIRISASRPLWEARYDLAEEWAHCMAGFVGRELRDHGPLWGMAYSTVRREIMYFERETQIPGR